MICQPKQNKSLLSKLTEVESKPGYYFNGKSLHYTIYEDKFMKNSSTKNSNFHQKEPETNCSIAFEIKADVEKMDNKEKLTYSRGVPEQPFLWGMCRHGISFKMLNQLIPFLHFKMEDLSQSKPLGRLDVKNGPN